VSALGRMASGLAGRLFPPPIGTAGALAAFVGQRAAQVAQTALYGYLKARMGTKFPVYFQDPGFAGLIRTASVRLFVSCAGDLAVHAAAAVGGGGRLGPEACAALARRLFRGALDQALAERDRPDVPPDAEAAFAARTAAVDWEAAASGEAAFAGSAVDLARVAPVSEEFKALDRPIVRNSIRFLWIDVRTALARRLDAAAVAADWRGADAGKS
jgi:hypothetical protein